MTCDIYHVTEDAPHGYAFRPHPEESWNDRREKYRFAGSVDAESLSGAYKRTQHVGGDWTEEADHSRSVARSTSVGDVIITDEGEAYEVARVGFTEIEIV